MRQTSASDEAHARDLTQRLEDLLAPMSSAVEHARSAVQQASGARRDEAITMSELIAYFSHELNQPLAAVVTNAQACGRWLGHRPPNVEEALLSVRGIADDAKRASQVVARVRAQLPSLVSAPTRVRPLDLLQELARSTSERARAAGVTLEVQCEEGALDVLADLPQLRRVLRELIDNALDALTKRQAAPRELTLLARRGHAGEVWLGVRDSGPGLPEGNREQAFEPLYTTKQASLGLGLTVCRSLLRAQGGRLWASENPEGGETLLVSLPAAPAQA